jgi:hypothetical protein
MYKDKSFKVATIRVREETWKRSGEVLGEIGISRSAFIQTILEGVVNDDQKSLTEQIKGTAHKLIDKVKLREK